MGLKAVSSSGTGGGSGTVTSVSVTSANGLAGTVANPTTTPAITLSTTITDLLKGNGTSISAATAGTDYSLPISVTAGTPDIVINPSPGTGTFTVGTTAALNNETATTPYTIQSTDMGKVVTHSSASAIAVTLPQAGTTGFTTGVSYSEINLGTGLVTVTPTTSTINGATTLVLQQYQGAWIYSDGTNWVAFIANAIQPSGYVIKGGSTNQVLGISSSNTIATSFELTNTAAGGHDLSFGSAANAAAYPGAFVVSDNTANAGAIAVDASGRKVVTTSGGVFGWSTNANFASSTVDSGFSRLGSNSVALGNGTSGNTGGQLTLGTLNSTSAQTTLNGTTAGTVVWSQPFQGSSYKKFVAHAAAYENNSAVNQTITYATAFTNTPTIVTNDTGLTLSTTTTVLTIVAPNNTTTFTGNIIVEGF